MGYIIINLSGSGCFAAPVVVAQRSPFALTFRDLFSMIDSVS